MIETVRSVLPSLRRSITKLPLINIVSQLPYNGLKVVEDRAALSRMLVHQCGRAGSVMQLSLRFTSPRKRITASHLSEPRLALGRNGAAPRNFAAPGAPGRSAPKPLISCR